MDLLNDIEEDIRRAQFERAWKKAAPFVLGAAGLALLATIAVVSVKSYRERQAEALSVALLPAFEKDAPAASFAVAKDKKGALPAFVNLQQAEEALKNGESEKAIAALKAAIAQSEKNPDVHAYASWQLAAITGEQAKPESEKSAFASEMKETNGWNALQKGDSEQAKMLFTDLAKNETTMPAVRQRAEAALLWLGQENGHAAP